MSFGRKRLPWNAVAVDQVDNLRHPHALADRAALVRAEIAIGVIFAAMADDADFSAPGCDDADAAFGDLAVLADQYFSHFFPSFGYGSYS